MERATGFEPATPSSGSWCSAPELRPLFSSTLYYVTLAAFLKAREGQASCLPLFVHYLAHFGEPPKQSFKCLRFHHGL